MANIDLSERLFGFTGGSRGKRPDPDLIVT
jgi:hypothetical protein